MTKKHDTRRGDLMRRIADVHAQLDELRRNGTSGGDGVKKRKELEQELADSKQQLLR